MISAEKNKKHVPNLRFNLVAVNKTKIYTYGVKKLSLDIGLSKNYSCNFLVADIAVPIIGADFLVAYRLLPDLESEKMVEKHTLLNAEGEVRESSQISVCIVAEGIDLDDEIVKLLHTKYADLLKPPQYREKPQHDILHFIETGNTAPGWQKPRRLRPEIAKKVKNEFKRMEKIGIVQQSKSQWVAPIVVQEKSSNDIRIVGDYHRLNNVTIADR